MDNRRFDRLTRLAARASRRSILRAIAGGIAGGIFAHRAKPDAAAAQIDLDLDPILCLSLLPGLSLETCLALPNVAEARCESGHCVIDACAPGWANCDGRTATGCEAPLGTAENCGACGEVCESGVCVDGRCQDRPPACEDGIPCGDGCCRSTACQTGLCVDGACYTQPANEGEACDPGDPCTTGGVCTDGVCVGSVLGCPVCTACLGGDCVADATQDGKFCGENGVCRDGECVVRQPPPCVGGVLCDDVCCPPETIGCTVLDLPDGTTIVGCLCPEGLVYEEGECLPGGDVCEPECEVREEPGCGGTACGSAEGLTCCPAGAEPCACRDGQCECPCPESHLTCWVDRKPPSPGTCVPQQWPDGGIGCCSDADCPDDPGLYCCLDEAACGHVHYCVIQID